MTINVGSLFSVQTVAVIFDRGISVARALGLPVTTWETGDPTRSLYMYLAEALNALEGSVAEYIKAGFLSSASGDWLKVLAWEVFGVEALEATYGTPTVTITNTKAGSYGIGPGDLTVSCSLTGKTYHSTSGPLDPTTMAPIAGNITGGMTVVFELVADEPGSDSNASANQIDTFVTTFLGLQIVSSTASIGQDEQSEDSIKTQCASTLGALSPNGPADAYEYVCRNPDLTGTLEITRARSVDDSDTGDVTVFLASASGPVSSDGVTAAQNACEQWATPLCITPTAQSSSTLVVNVAAVMLGDLPSNFAALATAAMQTLFPSLDIGDADGYLLDPTTITTAIRNAVPACTGFASYSPNSPVSIPPGFVPTLGTVSITD